MKKSQKTRIRSLTSPWMLQEGQSLSRNQAIAQVQDQLALSDVHPQALRLIELFNIEPEELSEAGLSYESLKALERHALFI
ncbi:hypothetical protein [Vampirovibrio chlorellavorus]|uniref:hypothetical protein n=1 Tax=Vampirovibrio chlorellavorus TaxID=758823 RepID=UPI0026EF834E|nr:hypothetical protein [Vampirovibrio chlorellavorus]